MRRAASCVVVMMTLMFALPAAASQPLDGLLACRRIAGSAARLACFDRESAAVAARTAQVAGQQPTPVQTFGLPPGQVLAREEAARRLPRPQDHIAAHILALGATSDGREIFTLDNQQEWVELEPDGDLYAKPGEAVEISRGWLGSYSLSLQSRRSSKVKRLR